MSKPDAELGGDLAAGLSQEQALGKVRGEIDRIDREIQQLFNARAQCAQQVAQIKAHFDSEEAVFYRPEREAQVLRAVMARNEGPLPGPEVARLFREIMSVCLAHEKPLQVVFAGAAQIGAALAEQAATKHFGHSAQCTVLDDLSCVFAALEQREADYGIVPLAPGLADVLLPLLSATDLQLCGEVSICIHQHGQRGDHDTQVAFLVLGRQYVGPSGEDKHALLLTLPAQNADPSVLLEQQGAAVARQLRADSSRHLYLELLGHSSHGNPHLQQALQAAGYTVKGLGSFPCAVL